MKYLLQMIVDESYWQKLTPEETQPMIETMERYNQDLRDAGVWVSGEGLDLSSNAKAVRVTPDGGRTVDDGPFSDARDQLGGFWIIETQTIDEAVEWAKRVPLSVGGVEVRMVLPENAYEA
jgi:hypothetical protein